MLRNQSVLLRPLGFNHVAATILTCSLGSRVNVMVFHRGMYQKARIQQVRNLPNADELVEYLMKEQKNHRTTLLKKTRDYLNEATRLVKIKLVNEQGRPGQFKGKTFRLTNICINESQHFFDMRELFLACRRVNKKIKPKIIAKLNYYLQELQIPGVPNCPRPFINLEYYQEKIAKEWQLEEEECRQIELRSNNDEVDE